MTIDDLLFILALALVPMLGCATLTWIFAALA